MAEQKLAMDMVQKYGAENVIVVIGFTSTFTLGEVMDEELGRKVGLVGKVLVDTFLVGDPAGAGALKNTALGVKTFSIFEFEDQIPREIWKDKNIGISRKKRELGKEELKKLIDRLKELRGD